MGKRILASLSLAAALACGGSDGSDGSDGPLTHPTLDQDYSGNFAGDWYGSITATVNGQVQTGSTGQTILRTGENRLSLLEVCPGIAGVAGLDSATTFSMDPLTCAPEPASCGSVTIAYRKVEGTLAGTTLTVQMTAHASGCGQNLDMAITFVGARQAPVDYGPPYAAVAPNPGTSPGVPVELDASGSSDPNALALSFAWTTVSQPSGGDATLTGADTARPTFTATVAGDYGVDVVVTASDGQSAAASVTVTIAPPIVALPHRVADAAYSRALDRLVMTDGNPSALYLYDPATGTESPIPLELPPRCLSVSPDGSHALIGHDAWVSYVDLVGGRIEKTIPVSLDVASCVLAGNGWAHLFPASYAAPFASLEIATGVEVAQRGIYQGSVGVLGPGGLTLYAVTVGLSPAQIYRYDLSGGAAVMQWGAPYWGDHGMAEPLWLSADGARLFTGSGTTYRTSSIQAQDLVYGGTLSGMGAVKALDSSAAEIAAIARPGWTYPPGNDTTVELFNVEYLGHVDRITLPRWRVGSATYPTHGLFVFYGAGGTRKHVVVQADGSSGLLHDTAVLSY